MTLREQTQERERITLSPLACRSAESRGRVRATSAPPSSGTPTVLSTPKPFGG